MQPSRAEVEAAEWYAYALRAAAAGDGLEGGGSIEVEYSAAGVSSDAEHGATVAGSATSSAARRHWWADRLELDGIEPVRLLATAPSSPPDPPATALPYPYSFPAAYASAGTTGPTTTGATLPPPAATLPPLVAFN